MERAHLSIGEVLGLLQDEFPDVTISKIRFLESQGLLDPERTPSGYRKFYDDDIVRLRWILRQQRENFLPLKVIKDRLLSGEVDFSTNGGAVAPLPPPPPPAAPAPPPTHTANLLQEAPRARADRTPPTSPARAGRGSRPARPLLDGDEAAVSLSREDLIGATGLTPRELSDLEKFGMVLARSSGSTTYYDEDALLVARLAASFKQHGVEARHLRMYKVAAEREAGVFEQLVAPMMRKRKPQARADALAALNELAALGDAMRDAMVRQMLRDYLGS